MFITIEGIKYHIKIKGKGKPIFCLHGFSENLNTWDEIKIPGYRMIMLDFIGHGKTEKPIDLKFYDWQVMVRHLNILINKLCFTKYSLLGYSMGGRIALAYALAYPNEIESLILESASYGECGFINRIRRRKNDERLAQKIGHYGINWFNKYWSEMPIFATQTKLDEAIKNKIEERRLLNMPDALANTLKGSGQGTFPCLENKISKLSMPVLFLNGEYDKRYRQIGEKFKDLNPRIRLEIIKGVGHNTHIEDSSAFNKIINNFLNK